MENEEIFDKLNISKDIFKANLFDYYKFNVNRFSVLLLTVLLIDCKDT